MRRVPLKGVLIWLAAMGCSGRPGSEGGGGQCLERLGPGDLVITEVFADGVGDDAGKEWFEVFNASGRDLNLEGVVIAVSKPDGSGEKRFRVSGFVIRAEDWLVFGNAMPATAPSYVDVPYASSLGSLPNSGGRIAVLCNETVVDEVIYQKAVEGRSWSLDGSERPSGERNDDLAVWCLSQKKFEEDGYGTPKGENEVCPSAIPQGMCLDGRAIRERRTPKVGDLVITEFLAKPGAADYRYAEWVEILVLSDVDLRGLQLGKGVDSLQEVFTSADCMGVGPGTFLVFVRDVDEEKNGGIAAASGRLPFGLSDSGMTIAVGVGGEVLDEVTYDSSWVLKGVAIGLDPKKIDPKANDERSNWCFATKPFGAGDFGSPFEMNEACK